MTVAVQRDSVVNHQAPTHADALHGDVALELVVARVGLRSRRRVAWLTFLQQRGTAADDGSMPESSLGALDVPASEAEWYERTEAVKPWNEELERIERALGGNAGAALHQLAEMFCLSGPEIDLLQVCLAVSAEPNLGAVYARLQQHPERTYPTEALAARLFGYGRRSLWSPCCPLAVWGLVHEGEAATGEPCPLAIDPAVVAWMHGDARTDSVLVGCVHVVPPRPALDGWPVDSTERVIRRASSGHLPLRFVISGPSGSGRRTFAAAVTARLQVQLLAVNTGRIPDGIWNDAYMRAQRLAAMTGSALAWHGAMLQRQWPGNVAPVPIQFVVCDDRHHVPRCEGVVDHAVDLPSLTIEERRRLWRANVAESAAWPAEEMETLVSRYPLSVGDVVVVGRRDPTSAREAGEFARQLTRHRLGELGRLLECPFTWQDLVVPQRLRDALEDFASEARDRAGFWESPSARRLFPRGTGLSAMFSGPPGTGKTMAAQVIAADLKLDLVCIDLASVTSKYIGETAKHLREIFVRAMRMHGVLLFDEADALFSRRTDVKDSHDRYANADTSYMLQLLEEYEGIVLLASNKRHNIDPAFVRRIRYVFDFPRPDAADRGRIWRQVIGELVGVQVLTRLERAIEALSANVEVSGAQIKNAVLAAVFVARRAKEPLAMGHLVRGIERELGKDRRALGTRERERLMDHG